MQRTNGAKLTKASTEKCKMGFRCRAVSAYLAVSPYVHKLTHWAFLPGPPLQDAHQRRRTCAVGSWMARVNFVVLGWSFDSRRSAQSARTDQPRCQLTWSNSGTGQNPRRVRLRRCVCSQALSCGLRKRMTQDTSANPPYLRDRDRDLLPS